MNEGDSPPVGKHVDVLPAGAVKQGQCLTGEHGRVLGMGSVWVGWVFGVCTVFGLV